MLNIYFLGKSRIEYNGKLLEDQLGSKAIALICLLVLKDNGYLSREKIVGYLWPDSSIEAARYNLRYNLWLIKKNIGVDEHGNSFLKVDNEFFCINKDYDFTCDITDIMKFKPSKYDSIDSILKLKKLFRGDLLEGFYFKKCEEFNDIIILERINSEQRKVKILKRLAELYENAEKYDSCIEIINEILDIEPYDEEMVLKVMDIYTRCGKRVAAITYYNNYSNGLAGSLGISPSCNLRNKYNEIRAFDRYNSWEENIDEKKCFKESSIRSNQTKIKIQSVCMKNIEYFWIADVIDKLIKVVDSDIIKSMSKKELLDLGYIQSNMLKFCNEQWELIQEYKREVMGVCIINAFINLLNNICIKHNLTIIILNSINIDEVSSNVLEYLKRLNIVGLTLIEK
ncbi:MAG: BTAD domain-containing putative transcriptional regulator [Sedimentibacter sp.]